MSRTAAPANPFALMLDPEQVIQAMERSDQLRHLKLRRLRPLDRPWIPFAAPACLDQDDNESHFAPLPG